jgi:hypothetical protein
MTRATDNPVATGDSRLVTREAALVAAERFLVDTADTINPDTSASSLLRHVARYRAHLAAVVAASRRPDGQASRQRAHT